MTPRLVLARAEMLRLIARYVPSHVYPDGSNAITKAAVELHDAALEVVPAELPVAPVVDPLAEALAREGIEVVSPQTLPPAPFDGLTGTQEAERVTGMHPALGADFEPVPPATEPATTTDGPPAVPPATEPAKADGPTELPVAAELGVPAARPEPDPLPSVSEAVADAMAPYEAPKMFETPTPPTAPSGKSRSKSK